MATAQSIYLDYNATARLRPQAAKAMAEAMNFPANASAVHRYGRQAKKMLEDARGSIAEKLNCWPQEIIFTSGGSESNSMALRQQDGVLLVGATEHSSVAKVREDAICIPVNESGLIELPVLHELLQTHRSTIISVMLANNETGVIQPVAQIAAICREHGALVHCDAVQALGKIPVDFTALGVDMMSLSAHKCGGPAGVGALIVRNDLAIKPLIKGGGQELGRRAGTENLAGIMGFAAALEACDLAQMHQIENWRDAFEAACEAAGGVVFGKNAPRLPNTSFVAMPGVNAEVQLMNFDLGGFAVSAGSACSSGKIEPSHVLAAMGVNPQLAESAVRISLGWASRAEELEKFSAEWQKTRLRLGATHDSKTRLAAGG